MKRSIIALFVVSLALPLFAQTGRMPGMGMRGIGDMGGMMAGVVVGNDGTAYVIRRAAGMTTNSFELAAVRPSGAVAWTSPIGLNGGMSIALNNTTLFVSAFGNMGTFPNLTIKSQLIGINVTTGAKVFTNDLEGMPQDLEAFADGCYLVEVAIDASGGGMMTNTGRKLVSVSNSGKVNFSLPLD